MKNNRTFLQQVNDMFKSIAELPERWLDMPRAHEQIRLIREALGMTQAQLAKKIHAKQSNVAEMETGSDFQISTLEKIAQALGCELVIQLVPKQEILKLLDEKSLDKARQLIRSSAGNAAMELQRPEKKYIDLQIQEMQKEILEKRRKILWEK